MSEGQFLSETKRQRLRPYPKYKNSGVEWLGEIPDHWRTLPLGRIGRFSASGIDKKTVEGEKDVKMVNYTDVYGSTTKTLDRSIDYMSVTCPPWKGSQHALKRGDILFTPSSETAEEVGWSAVVNEDMPDIVYSYHLLRFRPSAGASLTLGFSKYFCNNIAVLFQFSAACKGTTRQILTREDFRYAVVVIPPVEEQRTIASFLDRETAKIDALIEKKERLIELLQEKRTALITQAVTKGLDPTVPMKDSGIEWLGEIPAHWRTERNWRLFHESDIRSEFGEEELLTVSHLTGVTRHSEKNVTMIEAESYEGYKICKAGELVINTMWAWMGALGIAWEEGMASPSYNVYDLTSGGLNPRYYDYLCRIPIYVTELTRFSKGIWKSRLRLYPEGFYEISTPLPSKTEQEMIADFIGSEVGKVDVLMKTIMKALDRLKEYRTALISAAVTGKIYVRNV